tara:strand:+ start:2774 stop:2956 length:183 start_codon:yes stop_codon:yes gene_type:complete
MGLEEDSVIECPRLSCGIVMHNCFMFWAMCALLSGIGTICGAQWSIQSNIERFNIGYHPK